MASLSILQLSAGKSWSSITNLKFSCHVSFRRAFRTENIISGKPLRFTSGMKVRAITLLSHESRNKLSVSEQVKALCQECRLKEGLGFLNSMEELELDVYAILLQTCITMEALTEGIWIHTHMIKTGIEPDMYVGNNLINMYGKLGCLEDARQVFDKMSERNLVSWNTIIGGYVQHDRNKEALRMFCQMWKKGLKPNQFTFGSVLKACGGLGDRGFGKQVLVNVIKSGFDSDEFADTALIDMFIKCGSMEDACQVFDKMSEPGVVAWSSMIAGLTRHGKGMDALDIFLQMKTAGTQPNQYIFCSVLNACSSIVALEEGRQVHAHVVKSEYESDAFVASALLDAYAKCGCIEEAKMLFDRMSRPNVVSWTAMIMGCAQNGDKEEAIRLFCEMQKKGIQLNETTLASVVNVCANSEDLHLGKQVHSLVVKSAFVDNVFVASGLVNTYANSGIVADARKVFDRVENRDAIMWNAMIAGYAKHECGGEVLQFFHQMVHSGLKADQFSFASLLRSSACLADAEQGKQVHAYMIKAGFDSDTFAGSALVDMYAKNGNIEDASKHFQRMPERDVVSWTSMISGNCQQGHEQKALALFQQMHYVGMQPNEFTFSAVLSACAGLAKLEEGKQIHALIIKTKTVLEVSVENALITMYGKCGSIEDARKVFASTSDQNVVSWNSIIAECAQHGFGEEALKLFHQMQQASIKPNHITFVSVLSACSHRGLVVEGRHYFNIMKSNYGISPTMEHYACMVDILGRAGHLSEAMDFINEIPVLPTALIWRTLLGACRIHGNLELGERAAEALLKLEPQDSATYVLLSNIYAELGRWEDVARVRELMQAEGVKKEPGRSWINVMNKTHEFVVEDRSHPQTEAIYAKLKELTVQIKVEGYVPCMNFGALDIKQDHKIHAVTYHSERLATAFGLISTSDGTPIRIIKNLRVCGDCHTATKYISKVVGRQIVVRDTNRFHHFKDGVCSCGDYW